MSLRYQPNTDQIQGAPFRAAGPVLIPWRVDSGPVLNWSLQAGIDLVRKGQAGTISYLFIFHLSRIVNVDYVDVEC